MIRFNLIGLISIIVIVVIGGALSGIIGESAWAVAFGIMIPVDLWIRWRSETTGWEKWFSRYSGGYIIMIPVWLVGILLLGLQLSGALSTI